MVDTIFAAATGPGRAALAVLRVSGPDAAKILSRLCAGSFTPRVAVLRSVKDRSGHILDRGLVIWFPGPSSYTGEDVFELQVHGGVAVVEALSSALLEAGARLAEPGEFTRRAFEAGQMDLTQAEAVADLVDAETDAQRRQALLQLGGEQQRLSERWRSSLIEALAYLEAQIDFAEEDVPEDIELQGRALLQQLFQEISKAADDGRGERIRAGVRVALIGEPNAGKSSLLNALVKRDAAIVTAEPGTTRDVIEVEVVLWGYKVILADTAGIRPAADAVEREGVRRALSWASEADLRLLVVDTTAAYPTDAALLELVRPGDFMILSKSDAPSRGLGGPLLGPAGADPDFHGSMHKVSIYQEESLNSLRETLGSWASARLSGGEFPAVTRERHRRLLSEACGHLERGLRREGGYVELIAEDVRLAARALERLSGRIGSEDVLDHVFSSFCIGK